MTHQGFLSRLAGALAAAFLLAAGLRLGFGSQWFSFYGWATVALATALYATSVFWRRLPHAGRSRWWSLLAGLPMAGAAIVQIAYWALFFSRGPTNPTLGVAREMVLPWLEAAAPVLVLVYAAGIVWLVVQAGRPTGLR